jgi:hypothetical protein
MALILSDPYTWPVVYAGMCDKDNIEATRVLPLFASGYPRARLTVRATLPAVLASLVSYGQHVTRHHFIRTDYTGATKINIFIYPPRSPSTTYTSPSNALLYTPFHAKVRRNNHTTFLRSRQAAWGRSHRPQRKQDGNTKAGTERQARSTVILTTPASVQVV